MQMQAQVEEEEKEKAEVKDAKGTKGSKKKWDITNLRELAIPWSNVVGGWSIRLVQKLPAKFFCIFLVVPQNENMVTYCN